MSGRDDSEEDEPTPVVFPDTKWLAKGMAPPSDGDTLVFGTDPANADANFDYAAFEASLDAISDAEDQRVADAVAASEPDTQIRVTVPRRPRTEDASYAVRPVGRFTYVTVQGRINESFDGEALGTQVRGAAVIFDLADVDRITSFGVRGWLRMMQTASLGEAYFVRCSESVVNQITMIHNFCGPARVHSLIAPYQCEACGAEFGVPLFAVQDAELLRGRRPPEVQCPECSSSTEMDEDPWAFLDLDQQLLEAVPDDLQKVLDLLSEEPRHAPIEKAISGSGTTKITFNGALDDSTRFRRALGGIEGRVVVDLSHTESETAGGHRKLLDGLRRAAEDVEMFRLEGVGPDLGRALLSEVVPKLTVGSIRFFATNGAGIRRRVVIDIPENRDALLGGRPPRVDAAWATGGITLESPDLAADVVRSVGAEFTLAATPAPASRATPYGPGGYAGGHTAPPAPSFNGGYAPPVDSGAPTTTFMHPYMSQNGATPAPVSYVQSPPQPAPSGARYILAAAVVLAVLSVLVVFGAVFVVFVSNSADNPTAVREPIEAPAAAPAPAATAKVDGEWSSGGMAPPAWAGSPVMQTDTQLFVVGSGSGPDATVANAGAQKSAQQQLARYILGQLEASPVSAGVDGFPMPQDLDELTAALQKGQPLPMMTEAQAANRQLRGKHESMVQFAIEKSALSPYLNTFLRTGEYRGLVVAPNPPWSPRGLRLVKTPSWYAVPVGARVDNIDGEPVATVDEFVQGANGAFALLEDGDSFDIQFETADGELPIRISKKSAPKPKPELMKMDR